MNPPVFAVEQSADFDAFLQSNDRVLAYFHGTTCPFGRRFLPAFQERAPALPLPAVVRELDLQQDDEWEAHRIAVTPTVVVYEQGREVARVEAKPMLGLSPAKFDAWLARVAPPARS